MNYSYTETKITMPVRSNFRCGYVKYGHAGAYEKELGRRARMAKEAEAAEKRKADIDAFHAQLRADTQQIFDAWTAEYNALPWWRRVIKFPPGDSDWCAAMIWAQKLRRGETD